MAENTKIEWCDATLNLWWGCTKVSNGCKFCYAENLADGRYKKNNWGTNGTRQEVKSWRVTLNKISKRAQEEGRRLKVFCSSMCDVFEGPETMGGESSENWKTVSRLQDELLCAINGHPELDFLLLTKRPENAHSVVHRHDGDPMQGEGFWTWPSNLWLGVSVEDQESADERIPKLLDIPAQVRFLSCEPLLAPIEFYEEGFVCKRCGRLLTYGTEDDAVNELPCPDCWCGRYACDYPANKAIFGAGDIGIDWVIVGGESGANAREFNPDWARSIRDQCKDAGVAFFMKQMGGKRQPFAPIPDDLMIREFPR